MPLLSTEDGKYLTEPADGIFFNMNAIVPVIAQYCSEGVDIVPITRLNERFDMYLRMLQD
jgi:hypothetical protein